jgi:glycerophosphoryl diester phosphodiesterase
VETETPNKRPLVWAHRGACRQAPENTIAAFTLAERLGADGIELDAQLCASGEAIVIHDESLGRTTGKRTGIAVDGAQLRAVAIRALDAGARFDVRFAGERIPLLEDAISATSLLVNVELKCDRRDDRGLTSAVLRAVRRTASASRVLLSSFNPFCLLRARAEEPSLPRALLFERDAGFVLRRALSAPALGVVALHPQDELATDRAVAHWRRRGYAVSPWTVDDPLRAQALHRAGATAIITNVPDRLLEAFASRTSAPSPRR